MATNTGELHSHLPQRNRSTWFSIPSQNQIIITLTDPNFVSVASLSLEYLPSKQTAIQVSGFNDLPWGKDLNFVVILNFDRFCWMLQIQIWLFWYYTSSFKKSERTMKTTTPIISKAAGVYRTSLRKLILNYA